MDFVTRQAPTVAAARRKHGKKDARPWCKCTKTPKHAPDKRGGSLNSFLPAAEEKQDKKHRGRFRVGLNRIRNPHDNSAKGWRFYLNNAQKVPLFDGVYDDAKAKAEERGYIKDLYVRLNWGMQKTMPYNGHTTPFVYAWSVKLEGNPSHSSGWVPFVRKFFREAAYNVLKKIARCMKRCVDHYESSRKRKLPRRPSTKPIEYVIHALSRQVSKKYENLHTTRTKIGSQDRAEHYLPRASDVLSRSGYVNICYNLPEFHGIAVDTVRVGTSFFACKGSKKYVHRVKQPLYRIKKKKSVRTKRKLLFIYGYIEYNNGSHRNARRYGWIPHVTLRRKKKELTDPAQ